MTLCGKDDDVMGLDATCILEEGHEGGCFYATPEAMEAHRILIESLMSDDEDDEEADYR